MQYSLANILQLWVTDVSDHNALKIITVYTYCFTDSENGINHTVIVYC